MNTTTQTALEQMQAYAAFLRSEIERKRNNPYCVQQVADYQRDLEGTERRIAMIEGK